MPSIPRNPQLTNSSHSHLHNAGHCSHSSTIEPPPSSTLASPPPFLSLLPSPSWASTSVPLILHDPLTVQRWGNYWMSRCIVGVALPLWQSNTSYALMAHFTSSKRHISVQSVAVSLSHYSDVQSAIWNIFHGDPWEAWGTDIRFIPSPSLSLISALPGIAGAFWCVISLGNMPPLSFLFVCLFRCTVSSLKAWKYTLMQECCPPHVQS